MIIFSNFENNKSRLIDNNGDVGVIDIRRVGPDSSIERVSLDPNTWRTQPDPNPGSIITMLPEPRFTPGDSNQVCWTAFVNR